MTYPLTAPPAAADTNSDGYIDKVYIGDLGGQMWVFDLSNSDPTGWTGRRLFTAPVSLVSPYEKHPIYYPPTVALDNNFKPWVYFGTGDIENATDPSNPAERFYAVQDDGIGTYPRTEADLKNVTSVNTFTPDATKKGWFIQLYKDSQTREKVFSKPVIFNKLVYFTTTTYNPATDVCSVAGQANLYVVEYLSGGGAVATLGNNLLPATPSNRSVTIGSGAPSSPVISVDSKGHASISIGTSGGPVYSKPTVYTKPILSLHPILYWREVIP
jgi:type IV pilus assembly protein PilY1